MERAIVPSPYWYKLQNHEMNQNETKWPKINEVEQDSENLVKQIEQNEFWNLLKLIKMYQWDG